MALQSLRINHHDWSVFYLTKYSILLRIKEANMQLVHKTGTLISLALGNSLTDIVLGPDSITLFTTLNLVAVKNHLSHYEKDTASPVKSLPVIDIPICYELGNDLDQVADYCGISRKTLIDMHAAPLYTCAFIGFLPGFVYAEGLPPLLNCPRKEVPATSVLAGSVGIGGSMTGIYSLQSPGGWNIIGRTPFKTFIRDRVPPVLLPAGRRFRFKAISQDEFEAWGS